VQEALAWAGIDTFTPSLRHYDGTRPYAEGCDSTPNPVFQLDQQGSDILANPLGGQRLPHTSAVRFARTDVWVRDIRQVIEDAIARAQPTDGKLRHISGVTNRAVGSC
jgi:hypothetical protein